MQAAPPTPPHPPVAAPQELQDEGHLRLLGIFHFVFAGLGFLGLGALLLHRKFMLMLSKGEGPFNAMPESEQEEFELFFGLFEVFYLIGGVFIAVAIVLNLLSGVFLRRAKNRLFSLIVAGMNCLQVPLGTVLGIFTFIVLLRTSVAERYERNSRPG